MLSQDSGDNEVQDLDNTCTPSLLRIQLSRLQLENDELQVEASYYKELYAACKIASHIFYRFYVHSLLIKHVEDLHPDIQKLMCKGEVGRPAKSTTTFI